MDCDCEALLERDCVAVMLELGVPVIDGDPVSDCETVWVTEADCVCELLLDSDCD
jgi:hypothetical protein